MNLLSLIKLLTWEVLNKGILKFKKGKKYQFPEKYRVLNVGCGFDNPPGSLGIDGGVYVLYKHLPSFFLKKIYKNTNNANDYSLDEVILKIKNANIIHYDLTHGLPFSDNSVPNIFTSHFLEHLSYEDAQRFLRECFRVLKPLATIRIVVPSLDKEVQELREAVADFEKGNVSKVQKYVTAKDTGYKDPYTTHKYMYNFAELRNALIRVGFGDIKQCFLHQTQNPSLENLDTKDGLIVEATKIDTQSSPDSHTTNLQALKS